MITFDEAEWCERQAAHVARVDEWIAPHLERRRRGIAHPVWDFMFDYYNLSPAKLRRWHPGFGVTLAGDVREFVRMRGYIVDETGAQVDPTAIDTRLVTSTLALLRATASRDASFGCFGRHEWAMVYRLGQDEVRHSSWPLRLSDAEIADVVESAPLRCTHFDAFRFYTDAARPLNVVQPTRATQVDLEQPGCLHASMDLYKWAYRTYPVIGSDLLADAFALARDVRAVDMQAAPYDLSDLGFEPIRIETPEGRAEYVAHQRAFAERGQALRARLIECLSAPVGLLPAAL
jgi:hypothetical protein